MNPRSQRAWDNFRRRVAEQGHTVLETEWLGALVPHRCRCVNGHECKVRPAHVQQGGGICRICIGHDSATAWQNFKLRVDNEWGGKVLEKEWLGNNVPHHCLCANGHECNVRPAHVQQGGGICIKCSYDGNGRNHNRSITAQKNFYSRVSELDAVVLEKEWLGSDVPHRCLCVNGHECWPRPSKLVSSGNGICRACAGKDPITAWENFKGRMTDEFNATILESEWLGSNTPHHCLCSKGHDCWPRPGNVTSGWGFCKLCAWEEQDVFYVVYNAVINCVKFGITSRDGRSRLSAHRGEGFTRVIYLKTGLSKGLAIHTEQKIKAALITVGAKPVQGREYFHDEYLALIINEISNWI